MEDFKLLNELSESRLFPNKTKLLKFDEKYLGELVYLYTILLIALSQEDAEQFESLKDMVMEYASRASTYRSFKNFRLASNDLYMATHQIVQGPEGDPDRYIDYDQFDEKRLIRMLVLVARGYADKIALNDIMRMESQLKIKDSQLKNVRRNAVQWSKISNSAKVSTLKTAERILRRISMRAEMLLIIKKALKLYKGQGVKPASDKESMGVGKALAMTGAGLGAGLFLGSRGGK